MKKVLNASIMRIIMTLLLIVILAAMIGAVTFAYSFLGKASEDVGKMQNEAVAIDSKIQNLLVLKDQLDKNSDIQRCINIKIKLYKIYQPMPTAQAFQFARLLSRAIQKIQPNLQPQKRKQILDQLVLKAPSYLFS